MKSAHTSENLLDEIKKVLSDWKLSEKHITFVSDNASDIKHALKDLGNFDWLGCTAHNLNLVVKEATKVSEAHNLVVRCKNIVTHIKQSNKAMYFLRQYMEQDDFLPSLTVLQECPTRWWSMLKMLQRIVKLWTSIASTIVQAEKPDLMLSEQDIIDIKGIIALLQPFKLISETLEGEKYVTVSMIQSFIDKIQKHLQPMTCDTSLIKNMKKSMLEKLLTRHSDEAINIIRFSSKIDPRFKRKEFNSTQEMENDLMALTIQLNQGDQDSQSQIGPTQGQAIVNLSTIINMPSTSTSTVVKDLLNIFDSQDDVDMGESELSLEQKISNEISQYNAMKIEHADKLNVLDWWKAQHVNFPHLFKVFQKYLHVPSTSVPSERMFSLAGNILTERRACLSPRNVNMLTFLNHNQNYIPKNTTVITPQPKTFK